MAGSENINAVDVIVELNVEIEQLQAENEKLKDKVAELRLKIDDLQTLKGE